MALYKHTDRSILFIISLLMIIIGASLFSKGVQSVFHELTNILAGGRNPIRLFIFFAHCIFLLLITRYKLRSENVSAAHHPSHHSRIKTLTIALMLGAFIVNIAAFFFFTSTHGLPNQQYVISGDRGEITTNRLIHNHMGKAPIGLVTEQFLSKIENADPGIALLGFTSLSLAVIYGLLCLIIIVLLYTLFWNEVSESKHPILFTCTYAILSFVLIKSLFDGGIFAETTFIALYGFISLLQKSKDTQYAVRVMIAGTLMFCLIHAILLYGNFYTNSSEFVTHMYKSFVFLTLTIALLLWNKSHNSRRLCVLVSILAGTACASLLYVALFDTFTYRNTTYDPGEAIVGTYRTIETSRAKKLFNINGLTFYTMTDIGTIGDLIDEDPGVLDNFYPVSVKWKTCIPHIKPQRVLFTFMSPVQASTTTFATKYTYLKVSPTETTQATWSTYAATLIMSPCLNRPLNIIDESLAAIGIQKYILYDLNLSDN